MTNVKKMASTTAKGTSLQKIDAGIKDVKSGFASTHKKVQEVGILIMQHAKDYGDCDRARKLARAVPARERNSLIGWFRLYSPIGVLMGNTVADDKARFIKRESKAFNDFNLAAAKANNWWDDPAKVNPEPKPLMKAADFFAMCERMIERQIKLAEEGRKVKGGDAEPVFEPEAKSLIEDSGNKVLDFMRRLRAKQLGAADASTSTEAVKPARKTVKKAPTTATGLPVRQAANG
jgi:hypothetical protein